MVIYWKSITCLLTYYGEMRQYGGIYYKDKANHDPPDTRRKKASPSGSQGKSHRRGFLKMILKMILEEWAQACPVDGTVRVTVENKIQAEIKHKKSQKGDKEWLSINLPQLMALSTPPPQFTSCRVIGGSSSHPDSVTSYHLLHPKCLHSPSLGGPYQIQPL